MHPFKPTLIKTSLATAMLGISSLAMAHPGHLQGTSFSDAVQAGLVHPFTGADHMMLAVGMGMLMYRYRHSAVGLGSLTAGLGIGFGLAVSGWLSHLPVLENLVEYGILASVLVVAVSLLSKKAFVKNTAFTMTGLVVLAVFHGMAHGLEVPNTLQAEGFFVGMLVSMTALFAIGTGLMIGIKKYFGDNVWVQRVLAVMGLTAVALG